MIIINFFYFEILKCQIFYGGNLFDFSPLSHKFDKWKISGKEDHLSYSMNVCEGIHRDPSCPESAAVCEHNSLTNKAQALAFTDQMFIKVNHYGSAIEMVFNNTKTACGKQSYSIVLIQFKCHSTFGRPMIDESYDKLKKESKPLYLADSDCVLAFEWKTRLACSNSTNIMSKVDVINGVMIDSKHSQIQIDMTDIIQSVNGFIDDNDRRPDGQQFEYYIQFEAQNPKFQERNDHPCFRSIICQFNQTDLNKSVRFELF